MSVLHECLSEFYTLFSIMFDLVAYVFWYIILHSTCVYDSRTRKVFLHSYYHFYSLLKKPQVK